METATECLGAARSCRRDRSYADAVYRAYYAVLHAAKAALHLQGIDAESHTAVKRLFGLYLVQPGWIEPEWSTYLGESSEARLMAEYDVEVPFFEETRARNLTGPARSYLGFERGFSPRG